jgi:putative hemolysin
MAYPLTFLQKIFKPVTSFLIFSSSFVKRRTGTRRSNISMDDLSDALELTSDNFDEDEKILKGIVNFGNINVSAIMCSRTDVTAIDIKSGFDKIVPFIISSGFSRIPVYSGSFDTVKGILYAKDVLPYTNNPCGFKWQALLRPPYFVPETKKINDLLKEFQTRKIHMAVVIDEYGGTSGIVTLEDILEEIVGDIEDEHDTNELIEKVINESEYIFSGRLEIDYLNEKYQLNLPEEDDFETLAGMILFFHGSIPKNNDIIRIGNIVIKVLRVTSTRLDLVNLKIE